MSKDTVAQIHYLAHCDPITAVFNDMRTLKFKSRPAVAFFTAVNQISGSFRLLPSSDHTRLEPLVNMAETMADFTAADQGFQEDSQDSYEYVSIELPDSEETQIVDSEEDQVRLF